MSRSPLRLNAFLMQTGHHIAAWRHPEAHAAGATDIQHYIELAQQAEAAKFDAIFIADTNGIRSQDREHLGRTARSDQFEPLTLLSALATHTKHIGLIGTASTTFHEPYNLARKFASLDLISHGRAGWNLVTSNGDGEFENYGASQHLDHATRYDRAAEFHQVVTGLWNTWGPDAFIRDKASGVFLDPDKMRVLHHKGRFFSVRGPLNIAPSEQGHPIIVQAGASSSGIDLAARTADIVFVAHQNLAQARQYYQTLKDTAAGYGRQSHEITVMPGILPVVGKDESDAQQKFEALQALIDPSVGVRLLSRLAGADLTPYPIDGPVPELAETNGGKSRQHLLVEMARQENLTIRQAYLRIAGGRGHLQLVGSPGQIADTLQQWYEEKGADGFNIMPPTLPEGLTDFIQLVLPELRKRGLVREAYTGATLRENLGLALPANARR